MTFARRPWIERRELDGMSTYLVLVGLGQAMAFLLLCYAPLDQMLVRYVLLTLLALCGLAAFAWRRPALRTVAAGMIVLDDGHQPGRQCSSGAGCANGAPPRDLNVLADALVQRGSRYAEAGYWTALRRCLRDRRTRDGLYAAWRSGNRIAPLHVDELDAHRGEVFTITGGARPGCEAIGRWHLCPPPKSAK